MPWRVGAPSDEDEDLLAGLVARSEGVADPADGRPRLRPAPRPPRRRPRLAEQQRQGAAEELKTSSWSGSRCRRPAYARDSATCAPADSVMCAGSVTAAACRGSCRLVNPPLLPVEIGVMNDVPAHGATIPSAPMAEPRPAALPPAERTIGQLVGESIRFYGEHFWPCLALGLASAVLAVVIGNVSRTVAIVLLADALRCHLERDLRRRVRAGARARPDNQRLVVAAARRLRWFSPPVPPPRARLS